MPLPEVFWKARDQQVTGPQHKEKKERPHSSQHVAVKGLLAALRAMDPCDWRGEHDEWLKLMTACQYEGIRCEDFVRGVLAIHSTPGKVM